MLRCSCTRSMARPRLTGGLGRGHRKMLSTLHRGWELRLNVASDRPHAACGKRLVDARIATSSMRAGLSSLGTGASTFFKRLVDSLDDQILNLDQHSANVGPVSSRNSRLLISPMQRLQSLACVLSPTAVPPLADLHRGDRLNFRLAAVAVVPSRSARVRDRPVAAGR